MALHDRRAYELARQAQVSKQTVVAWMDSSRRPAPDMVPIYARRLKIPVQVALAAAGIEPDVGEPTTPQAAKVRP